MNKIRRKRQREALMLITAAGIMLSLAGIAAARYMKQESQSGVVEAQTFYFTSDLLKEDGGTAAYFIDPMAQSFTIELYNFADSATTLISSNSTVPPPPSGLAAGITEIGTVLISPAFIVP